VKDYVDLLGGKKQSSKHKSVGQLDQSQ